MAKNKCVSSTWTSFSCRIRFRGVRALKIDIEYFGVDWRRCGMILSGEIFGAVVAVLRGGDAGGDLSVFSVLAECARMTESIMKPKAARTTSGTTFVSDASRGSWLWWCDLLMLRTRSRLIAIGRQVTPWFSFCCVRYLWRLFMIHNEWRRISVSVPPGPVFHAEFDSVA